MNELAPARPGGPPSAEHFGVKVRRGSKHGLHISRETYTNVSQRVSFPDHDADPAAHGKHSTDDVAAFAERALHNFDLNMMFFARIDEGRFQQGLIDFLAAFPGFTPVTDLRPLLTTPGIYIMVLDDSRQLYIGQSIGIGRRIREHWSGSKELDRLVFGGVDECIMTIDSFRALDTTRIYAWTSSWPDPDELDAREEAAVRHIDPDLTLNRMDGGDFDEALLAMSLDGGKVRYLTATAEEWAAYQERLDAGALVSLPGSRESLTPVLARATNSMTLMPGEDEDPIQFLVDEAGRRARSCTLLVDAGGTIIEVCEHPLPGGAIAKNIQLFEIPCGADIDYGTMQDALRLATSLVDTEIGRSIILFEKVGNKQTVLCQSQKG